MFFVVVKVLVLLLYEVIYQKKEKVQILQDKIPLRLLLLQAKEYVGDQRNIQSNYKKLSESKYPWNQLVPIPKVL